MDDIVPEGKNAKAPSIVKAYADQVKMAPISWFVAPDYVTIVFEQGPKMRFERTTLPEKLVEAKVQSKPEAPAIQKLPVKRQTTRKKI
jgi:hypothetical protein